MLVRLLNSRARQLRVVVAARRWRRDSAPPCSGWWPCSGRGGAKQVLC